MFYRGLDEQHPLYPETSDEARNAIHWIYQEADRVLGETMNRMGPGILMNERGQGLIDAAYQCLGYSNNRSGVWLKKS